MLIYIYIQILKKYVKVLIISDAIKVQILSGIHNLKELIFISTELMKYINRFFFYVACIFF